MGVDGVRGERMERTRERKAGASKVNAAPRRAWAFEGSGMEERVVRG